MRILVVGGAGYVGSVLVPKLYERGYDVDVIDLLWFGNHLPPYINVIQKDAFNLTAKDLEKYDQVIFLAGLSNDPMAEFSPKQNFIQNCSLPSYLVFTAKQAGVKRFIFASSCSIYGYSPNKFYYEYDHVFSMYPYGIAKIQAEYVIKNMADENFSTICLRKGTISGYSPRMRLDLVINAMFKSAILNRTIIVNNSDIWRPILSIDDAIEVYIKSIEAPHEISGIFNVASGNYQILQIAKLVLDSLHKYDYYTYKDIDIKIKNIEDFRNYRVTTKLSRYMLNVNYKSNIDDIVKNLLDNVKSFIDLNNINYYNIEVFKNIKF